MRTHSRRRLAAIMLAACLAAAVAACAPAAPDLASPSSAATFGIHPDGVETDDVPADAVTISTSVGTAAVISAEVSPNDAELTSTIAELLATSMFTVTSPDDFALELMHGAVLTDVARAVAESYGSTLAAVYPPTGADGPWTLAVYDPPTDAVDLTPNLTRSAAEEGAQGADRLVVVVEQLATQ